ncbi:MAG: HAD family hydrolase [Spirochaetia bacterium]
MKKTSSVLIFPDVDIDNVGGIMIDIDDTLYEYEVCHKRAINACYQLFKKQFGLPISLENFIHSYRNKRKEVTNRLLGQGCCRSRGLAFQSLFEELGISCAYKYALQQENLYWDIFIKKMKVNPKAKALLKLAKTKQIPVCAVTDMQTHFQVRKIAKLGLEKYITYLVTSEEVGQEKPSRRIFEYALAKLGSKAYNTVMIGDSLEKDIIGARNIGLKSYQATLS